MAQKTFVFEGEAYWSKVYEGHADEYNGEEFYKITVALTDESWAIFNKSGLKLKAKPVSKEEPNKLGIQFKRNVEPKVFKDKTGGYTEIGGGAPSVVDANGHVMTADQLIGNTSKVQVKVMAYRPKKNPSMVGHRLEAIKVLKLVPYEPNDDWDSYEEGGEQQEETPTEAPKKQKASNKDIPF